MKLRCIILLIISALLPVACRHKTAGAASRLAVVHLTAADNGKSLTVNKTQVIILTLPDKVDGGYRFDTAAYDSDILKLQNKKELPPSADHMVMGSPGSGMWQFSAFKTGQSKLVITASRPWAKADKITIFTNIVTVK